MKRSKLSIVLIFLYITVSVVFSQNDVIKLHGYLQTRLSSDIKTSGDFSIRRAKVWIDGNVPNVSWMTYKVQAVYRSTKDVTIMLQDAFVSMQIKDIGCVKAGRFVPDFILQRMQPDYEIPDLERADVVNNLVFNPHTMARQIGAQMTFEKKEFPLRLSVGIFNENCDVPTIKSSPNFLYTSHAQLRLVKNENIFASVGASFGYRYVKNQIMAFIYSNDRLITGNDIRFGVESQFELYKFGLQAEYIQANMAHERAWGYYLGSDYLFSEKIQATAGIEKLSDMSVESNKNPWFGFGANYYFTERTKLMAELKHQKENNHYNHQLEFQLQVFFN